jgi:hypothetical protein
VLQAFFSVRSERQLMEQLDYNLLFCWFVGLGVDDPVSDATVFTKTATGCWIPRSPPGSWPRCLPIARSSRCLSSDHFSVDGRLIEEWASLKSFCAKDGSDDPPFPGRNGERQFKGETRKNDTIAIRVEALARTWSGPHALDQGDM